MNERGKDRIMQLRIMPYEEYLKTPEWAEKREQALTRDDHRCRLCDSSEKLHVHHRTYANRGNEDLKDLTTLCENCHEDFHARIQHSQAAMMARTYEEPDLRTREELRASARITWERYLIGLLLRHHRLYSHVCAIINDEDFSGEETRKLYQCLNETWKLHPITSWEGPLVPTELDPVATKIAEETAKQEPPEETSLAKDAVVVASRIKRARLMQILSDIQVQTRDAERAGDSETQKRLWVQFREIRQQVGAIDKAMTGYNLNF